jgi:pimeloyl-ACP methyl ester carboxylesterase
VVAPSLLTRVLSRAASRLDRGVLQRMERRMRATAPRAPEMADARARLRDLAAHYAGGVTRVDAFFPEPAPIEARDLTQTPVGAGPHGSRVLDLAFPSTYRPFLRAHLEDHARLRENLTVHGRLYTNGDGRPVLVCLHGWGGGAYWLEERAFAVEYWLRRGYDVVLFQLPHHGRRLPAGRGRGSLFPSADVVRTNEAFGQAISDLRALRELAERRGAPAVGAIGMSLGGYTTALWATVDPHLAFAVPWIPAVDMADLMWRHGEDSPARRRAIAAGVDAELLREVFAVHAPTTRPPLIAPERRMIVAGQGDRITPPDQAERLWRHWGECAIHWFPGGHLAQVGRADAFRAVRRHLDPLAR